MNDQSPNHAYYATLLAICYLASIAALLAVYGKYTEALGFGGLTTGLIGIARLPNKSPLPVVPTTELPEPSAPQ